MTKLDVLNLYLKERLKVAADEIFQVIKDTILEYQNEIALTKEENRDLKQRLADVGTISAGIQRVLTAERRPPEPPSLVCERELNPTEPHSDSPDIIEIKHEDDLPIVVTRHVEEPQDINLVSTPPPYNTGSEQRLPNTFHTTTYASHMPEDGGLDGMDTASVSTGPPQLIKVESGSEDRSIVAFSPVLVHSTHTEDAPDSMDSSAVRCMVNSSIGYLSQNCAQGPGTLLGGDMCELPPPGTGVGVGMELSADMGLDVSAATSAALDQSHSGAHGNQQLLYCGLCGRCFSSAREMAIHKQVVHAKDKPYRCGVCGKSFRYSGKFKEHQRIHTGERPYRCHVCFKGFNQTAHLKVHLRVHTGEKPYSCPLCGKRFSQSSQIKGHLNTHKRQNNTL